MEAYASAQGKLTLQNGIFYDLFGEEPFSEEVLLKKISRFSGVTATVNSTATTSENRAAAQSSLASAASTASPLDSAPRGYRSPTKTEMRGILK